MTAGHFIFIPAILLIGIVVGWVLGSRAARDALVLGSRAARDAFSAELRRREEKAARAAAKSESTK
jgi:hypothetical protein